MHRRHLLLTGVALLTATQAVAKSENSDPDARAARVESQMTDDERFQLLHGVMPVTFASHISSAPANIPPTAGYVPGVPRLGVPDLLESDGSLGVANIFNLREDGATALPSGQIIAGMFDPDLAYAAGQLVGKEARAKGFNVLLGGGVNLTRDWYNGRNFEYLGEDPLLAGLTAGAMIRGTQSAGVVSTIKHFALNSQETLRKTLNAKIGEAALRESDLLAFEIAIEKGQPGSVMCGYNKVNGEPACGSAFLTSTVLKQDWGYKGWVMSDWQAVHGTDAFMAGLDQQSAAELDKQIWFGAPLRDAVAKGDVPRTRVSDAVRRILRSLYAVGADSTAGIGAPVDHAQHAQTARAVAAGGIVLLKNKGLLPIDPKVKSVLVVGGHADRGVLSGNGAAQVFPVGGPALSIPLGGSGMLATDLGDQVFLPSSPLKALQAALPGVTVSYESGYYPQVAAAAAARADLVIVFATQWQTERVDGAGFELPEGQDKLISTVLAANPKTVVVLETGNPVAMPWLDQANAVMEAWYPGQAGGEAIADILTGKVNPSGRLPMTFPLSAEDTPRPRVPGLALADGSPAEVDYVEGSDVGYRRYAGKAQGPLFAFGHGLSYTSFSYGKPIVTVGKMITARFRVTNTGSVAGADVPQLYLVKRAGQQVLRLAGFQKIALKPGEAKDVSLTLDPRILAEWTSHGWEIAAGPYAFALGHSATDLDAAQEVRLRVRAVSK